MFEPVKQSPLEGRAAPDNTYISMREIASRGMIDLRGQTSDRKFLAATKPVLGFELPKAPRTAATFGDTKALWLSPDQWLVLCARSNVGTLTSQLQEVTRSSHALAVDVSYMRSIIRLEGAGVRSVLAKCSSLDFNSAECVPGFVRRMRFAECAALVNIVEPEVFDLYVFRSYANYAWDFLLKASRKGSDIGLV